MRQINIHEAKTHLSALIEWAVAGSAFIIAKNGRPMVVVCPYTPPEPKPRTGFLKEQIAIPDDFERMGAGEIAALFGADSE